MPHEKTYGGYTLAELRAQVADNMADAVVGPLLDEMDRLKQEITNLRDVACGRCGRSLAPDGDCHGCRADRLEAKIKMVRGLLRAAQDRGKATVKITSVGALLR